MRTILFVGEEVDGLKQFNEILKERSLGEGKFDLDRISDTNEALNLLLSYADVKKEKYISLILLAPDQGRVWLDFLNQVKNHEKTHLIPIIGFVEKGDEVIIEEAYQSHINCLIGLPKTEEDCENIARSIKDFWLKKVYLPDVED